MVAIPLLVEINEVGTLVSEQRNHASDYGWFRCFILIWLYAFQVNCKKKEFDE